MTRLNQVPVSAESTNMETHAEQIRVFILKLLNKHLATSIEQMCSVIVIVMYSNTNKSNVFCLSALYFLLYFFLK